MAMSRERFDALVGRLEGFARAQPRSYRARVGLLAALGYALSTLAFIILRALWVRLPPPDGLPLQRQELPRLYAMVDELTTKLQAPRFHHESNLSCSSPRRPTRFSGGRNWPLSKKDKLPCSANVFTR
jgi:hypothetical protein